MSHNFLQVLPSVQNWERYLYEIRNREKWILLGGGERVLLYKRRWDGERCPNFDKVKLQHPQVDFCPICYGTNFVGGYLRPLEVYMSLASPVKQQVEIQEAGMRKVYSPVTWMLWEPVIFNKDFIVRRNGERHWVVDVQQTRFKHHILRQILQLDLVEATNQIYKIQM